jgi:hypothetical protein
MSRETNSEDTEYNQQPSLAHHNNSLLSPACLYGEHLALAFHVYAHPFAAILTSYG